MATFEGTAGDDTFTGGLSADQIFGAGGDDRLAGAQGHDLIEGGEGDDTLNGDGGDDTLKGDGGDDLIFGGRDFNRLFGGAGADTLNAALGTSRMAGGEGADSLVGGHGGDRLYSGDEAGDAGAEIDFIFGDRGSDTIVAGAGDNADGGDEPSSGDMDTLFLDLRGAASGLTVDLTGALTDGTSLVDGGELKGFEWLGWVRGSSFDDLIDVTAGHLPNLVPTPTWGGEGDDTLAGGGNRNRLEGEAGDDLLGGGGGDDTLLGGAGGDTLDGGGGFVDRLAGGAGADSLAGGDGADELRSDEVFGVDLGAEVDSLDGGGGADTVTAGLGDHADGGGGKDVLFLDYSSAATGLRIDLSAAFDGGSVTIAGGVIRGFEKLAWLKASAFRDVIETGVGQDYFATGSPGVFGGGGDDLLNGGVQQDVLWGDEGDDLLKGRGGGDQMSGGDGDDTVLGGDGGDALLGGAGADLVLGGDANDFMMSHAGRDEDTTVDTLAGGAGDDQIEVGYGDNADGGSGADALILCLRGAAAGLDLDLSAAFEGGILEIGGGELTGFERYATILGSHFDDRIVVGDARSLGARGDVEGGLGADSLTGGRRANELFGQDGDDVLQGLAGADTLTGGDGDDRLTGGDGGDVLFGGAGVDRFMISALAHSPADQPDLIGDLAAEDIVNLSLIDADAARDGDQKFKLVSGPELQAGEASLTWLAASDGTMLRLEIDGEDGADMVVLIAGDHTGFTNFVL